MSTNGGPPGPTRPARALPLSDARLPEPRRILSWLYVGRLCLAAAIFLAVLLAWRDAPPGTTLAATLILVLSGVFTTGSFWWSHLARHPLGKNFLYGQVVFDVVLVTWVVHLTGGTQSAFAPLYILVICAAAVLLPILGGILIGLFASLLYFADMALGPPGSMDVGALLQIGLFTTVALVTGYLGDRLRQTGAVLGELETELRLLRLDTDDILGSIHTAILTVDGRGRLLYLNPAASEILELAPHQWLGKPVLEKLDGVAEGLGEVIRRSAQERIAIRRYETTEDGDGGTILGVSTTLMERGTPEGPTVTAIFQDITERKRMEALRRRAERLEAVAELSASLAHEIKNPLASIRSAVEQLAGGGIDQEDKDVLEGLVIRESDRLSRLLAEFIDFARVRVRDTAPVRLREVVRHVVDLVRAHPESAGVAVRIEVADGVAPVVQGDEDLLHRAVLNLVLNGAQWAGPGGEVAVALDLVQSDILAPELGISQLARLRVSDTGPGVPPEDVDHVFDPFFTARPGGTGLGLAMVQRAVDAHGGAVFVDAARAHGDHGATFVMYLPVLVPEAEATTPNDTGVPPQ
ncbi:MAG: PAS domain S-box protein [Gemmatimonadetes bacterium]|nr:PAS domain S-box protein [Gemmatimonadota bacterium]